MDLKTEKQADAIGNLAAGAATTAIMVAMGETPMSLAAFVTYGGAEIMAEQVADLVVPKVEALLGMKSETEVMLTRPAIVAGTVIGIFMMSGQPGGSTLMLGAAAAGGCVVGNYVYKMYNPQMASIGAGQTLTGANPVGGAKAGGMGY